VPLFVIFGGVDPPWVVNFAQLSEKTPIFPRRLDSTGDVIAAKASGQLLCRSLDITLKETGPGWWGAKEVFQDLFRRIQAFSGFDPFIIYFGSKNGAAWFLKSFRQFQGTVGISDPYLPPIRLTLKECTQPLRSLLALLLRHEKPHSVHGRNH